MDAKDIVTLLLGLLSMWLIANGMFQLFSPMIPGGPIGWIIAGVILLVIMAYLFSRPRLPFT
jgi:hypothetical protein